MTNKKRYRLFQEKPDEEKRGSIINIRVTEEEHQAIQHAADIRCLNVSEFIRRAAFGRRADVRYETEIVVQLVHLVREIRSFHADYLERGVENPPTEAFRSVIIEAKEALLRISK